MSNSLFFNQVQETDNNRKIIRALEEYSLDNPTEQLYLITAPLSEQKYQYEYENNALVILW